MTATRADIVERDIAIVATLAAFAFAVYAYRDMPDKVGVIGFCALWTCYNATRTIWPMRVRERFLEPKDPARRAAHADAVAWFALFGAVALAVLFGFAIVFVATRSVQRPWLPLAIGPAAFILVMISFAMSWRVYARAIRHAHSAAHSAPTSPQSR